MNKRQTLQFQRTLEENGFLPWREPQGSIIAVAKACKREVYKQKAVFFYDFYFPALREYAQRLHESGEILKEQDGRTEWKKKHLDTLSLGYLEKVRQMPTVQRGFEITNIRKILRQHFQCEPIDVLTISLEEEANKIPAIESYKTLLEMTERVADPYYGKLVRDRRYRGSNENSKDEWYTQEAWAEKLKEKDAEDYRCRYYCRPPNHFRNLIRTCKNAFSNKLVAYTSLDDAVNLIVTRFKPEPKTRKEVIVQVSL